MQSKRCLQKQQFLLKLLLFFVFVTIVFAIPPPDDDDGEENEVNFCDKKESDNAQSDDAETEPSFCQDVTLYDTPNLYTQDDFNILAALSTSFLSNQTYPTKMETLWSFALYDELPHPVPTGASTFFMVLLTMIFSWYFNKFLHHIFNDAVTGLNLTPVTDRFPEINLYMLQQSRREGTLNRDIRNTWAWLANFYLLKASDTMVKSDEIEKPTGWKDFQVPKDVWVIIREVLKANAMDAAAAAKARKQQAKAKRTSSQTNQERKKSKASTASDPALAKNDSETERLNKLRNLMKKDTVVKK